MGMTKILGWGLDDLSLSSDGKVIDDERINNDSPIVKYCDVRDFSDKAYHQRLNEYFGEGTDLEILERVFERTEDCIGDPENDENQWRMQSLFASKMQFDHMMQSREASGYTHLNYSVSEATVCRVDNAERGVLVIVPFCESEKWFRRDDALDLWSSLDRPETGSTLVKSETGIYPYEGIYMDARDGRQLDTGKCNYIQRILDGIERKKDEEESVTILNQGLDLVAVSLGFKDYKEAKDNIAPHVPFEVRDVAEWLNVFTDNKTALQLRPMLYTFWS